MLETRELYGKTTILTLATPDLSTPIATAAPHDKSIIRLLMNGPRSFMRTITERPLRRCVTLTRVPNLRVRCCRSQSVWVEFLAAGRLGAVAIVRCLAGGARRLGAGRGERQKREGRRYNPKICTTGHLVAPDRLRSETPQPGARFRSARGFTLIDAVAVLSQAVAAALNCGSALTPRIRRSLGLPSWRVHSPHGAPARSARDRAGSRRAVCRQ